MHGVVLLIKLPYKKLKSNAMSIGVLDDAILN